MSLTSVIGTLIDWQSVSERIRELSEDPSNIDDLINEQMNNAIRELHPHDYEEFIEKNRERLGEIKAKVRARYSAEIRNKVSTFLISEAK